MFLTILRPQTSNLQSHPFHSAINKNQASKKTESHQSLPNPATPQSWRFGFKKHNAGSIQRRATLFNTPIPQTDLKLTYGGRECLHASHNYSPANKQSSTSSFSN